MEPKRRPVDWGMLLFILAVFVVMVAISVWLANPANGQCPPKPLNFDWVECPDTGRLLVHPPRGPQPTLAQEPVVVLEVYRVDLPDDDRTTTVLRKAVKAYGRDIRVITYPASYVPVLIPKEEYERDKRLLGKERVVKLRPFE